VPFLSISGSDFVEDVRRRGASRVRDLFRQAKGNSPCINLPGRKSTPSGGAVGTGLGARPRRARADAQPASSSRWTASDTDEGDHRHGGDEPPGRARSPRSCAPGRFDRQVMVDLPDAKAARRS